MKKILTVLAMVILTTTGALAQGKPSDTKYTIVCTDSVYQQGSLKSLRTPQGNTVVTWTEWPDGMNYNDPQSGYYLRMQVYDKDGKTKFPQGGIAISSRPTPSYITDYGLSLADNGDVVLAYFDSRNDEKKQNCEMYAYRYTQDGQPVWSKEGICFAPQITHNRGSELNPMVVASGDNIFFGCYHTEYYQVKADSTNWEPSPYYPDEPMPDSITVEFDNFQLQCMDAEGKFLWEQPAIFESMNVFPYAAPAGNLYLVYANAGDGLDAQLINDKGENVWGKTVNVEKEPLSGGMFFPTPVIESDGQGGLMFAYRRLLDWTGYIVINRLQSDGTVYEEPINCNGTTDGDGTNPKMGIKNDRAVVAWQYKTTKPGMMINELSLDGDYVWDGDSLLGYTVAENDQWGVIPQKVIPQQNGWVLLYGDGQSWNGANFYVEKIDDNGRRVWKKQIAENDFKSTGFAITYDERNAYIFYTCDMETGDDWETIPGPGGLRLMVVDITDATNGIVTPSAMEDEAQPIEFYNVQGMKMGDAKQSGLYIVKRGNSVKKMIVK